MGNPGLMTEKFGIGIIGAGMASKPHAKSFLDLADRVEVCGVYARSAGPRAAFCAQWGFPEAESFDALLADDRLDALLIQTPPNARDTYVARAAAAGKHILMEKPAGRTTADAKRYAETCEAAGVRLGIVFQHRFRAGSLALARLIGEGALGDLATAHLAVPWWRPQSYYDEPGRGTMARDGGGVLMSQAIHSMDLMLSLTGPVAEVQAMAGPSTLQRFETEGFVGAGMRFANGALGALMATVTCFPGDQEYIALNFQNASVKLAGDTLVVHWQDGRVENHGEAGGTGGGADPMDFPHDWHKALIVEFLDAVDAGRDPVSNGRTALQAHFLIDALLASSDQGRLVQVEQG